MNSNLSEQSNHEGLSEEKKTYYQKAIEEYRNNDVPGIVHKMAKGLNIEEIPLERDKVALDPEHALDWARRIVKLDLKYKNLIQESVKGITPERAKEIEIDPVDIQGATLAFQQLGARALLECAAARHPDMTVEDFSIIRGGGFKSIEDWIHEKMPEGAVEKMISEDDIQGVNDFLETTEAIMLISRPIAGASKAGQILAFAQHVEDLKKH